jgi:hypothetical protein
MSTRPSSKPIADQLAKKKPGNPGRSNRTSASCGTLARKLPSNRTFHQIPCAVEAMYSVTARMSDMAAASPNLSRSTSLSSINSAPPWLLAEEQRNQYAAAAGGALIGIQPNGELEGMLAAQLIACHSAAMECNRRAMNSQLPARDYHLNQANKLSRTYATILESLNKHRGKGQQKVTVEHVHVHQGGQAIVGHVNTRGRGMKRKTEGQPHAKATSDVRESPMRGEDSQGRALPIACHA